MQYGNALPGGDGIQSQLLVTSWGIAGPLGGGRWGTFSVGRGWSQLRPSGCSGVGGQAATLEGPRRVPGLPVLGFPASSSTWAPEGTSRPGVWPRLAAGGTLPPCLCFCGRPCWLPAVAAPLQPAAPGSTPRPSPGRLRPSSASPPSSSSPPPRALSGTMEWEVAEARLGSPPGASPTS